MPNGLYGIENARGDVDPFNAGFLYGSAMIFLFVLAVGAFVSVTMQTEAIQTGIGRLALRFKHSGSILVIVADEHLRPRRHDLRDVGGDARASSPCSCPWSWRSTTTASSRPRSSSSARAPGCWPRPSTRSPPASPPTRPASTSATGSSCASLMFVVLVGLAIGYVLWYCRRISRDPSKSIVGISAADAEESQRPGRGRAAADRAPEGDPRRLLPGLRDHDLRVRPVGRRHGHGLRRRVAVPDLRDLLLRRVVGGLHRRRGRSSA